MGICKCSKKRVTNQFCFSHKVNVCEFCMVNGHPTCIVQPYLQWLEDSSFKPKCSFCQLNLSNEECVRLLCYHVFHWTCLNKFYSSLPSNTTPVGYTCPDCLIPIFPSSNTPSPLFAVLKKKLSTTEWARIGLGLPIIGNSSSTTNNQSINPNNQLTESTKSSEQLINSQIVNQVNTIQQTFNEQKKNLNSNVFIHHNPPHDYDQSLSGSRSIPVSVNNVANYLSNHSNFSNDYLHHTNHNNFSSFNSSSRKVTMDTDYSSDRDRLVLDIDDDKYRSRPPLDRLLRYLKFLNYKHNLSANQRFMIMVTLSIFAIILIFYILIKIGRKSADNDFLLDPKYDPNIHLGIDNNNVDNFN